MSQATRPCNRAGACHATDAGPARPPNQDHFSIGFGASNSRRRTLQHAVRVGVDTSIAGSTPPLTDLRLGIFNDRYGSRGCLDYLGLVRFNPSPPASSTPDAVPSSAGIRPTRACGGSSPPFTWIALAGIPASICPPFFGYQPPSACGDRAQFAGLQTDRGGEPARSRSRARSRPGARFLSPVAISSPGSIGLG